MENAPESDGLSNQENQPIKRETSIPVFICENCEKNALFWSDETVHRIREWDALITIASRLTGKTQAQLARLVYDQLEKENSL